MNKKIITQFLLWTFTIMVLTCGIMVIFGQFGITVQNNFLLYIPYALSGLSPAIASYIVLKKNKQVSGFKEWLKNVFNPKTSIWFYLFIILMLVLFFVPQFIIFGVELISPIYMIILSLPYMLIGGGMEEAGWRYILQPELDKKYGFILSSLIVGIIWSIWHLPLFFIPEVGQYGTHFGLFAIFVVGLSFALGAIRKITNSVFLCVLFHCLINSTLGTFAYSQTLLVSFITTILLMIVSTTAVYIYEKKTAVRSLQENS